jgi:hypothetical protein
MWSVVYLVMEVILALSCLIYVRRWYSCTIKAFLMCFIQVLSFGSTILQSLLGYKIYGETIFLLNLFSYINEEGIFFPSIQIA